MEISRWKLNMEAPSLTQQSYYVRRCNLEKMEYQLLACSSVLLAAAVDQHIKDSTSVQKLVLDQA